MACYRLLQELCNSNLDDFLIAVKAVMYDKQGVAIMQALAPLLINVCEGMLYLHSRNIVHGGEEGSTGKGIAFKGGGGH